MIFVQVLLIPAYNTRETVVNVKKKLVMDQWQCLLNVLTPLPVGIRNVFVAISVKRSSWT